MAIALGELAVRFGLELRGDPDIQVERVATLAHAGAGALSFLANPRYRAQLTDTKAAAVIVNASGGVVYTYADDHEFVQTVGSSMVNNDDKLVYSETVQFGDLSAPLQPGNYTVQCVLANYPELRATATLTVATGELWLVVGGLLVSVQFSRQLRLCQALPLFSPKTLDLVSN